MQENDKRLRVRKALRRDVLCLIKVNLINFWFFLRSSATAAGTVVVGVLEGPQNCFSAKAKKKSLISEL